MEPPIQKEPRQIINALLVAACGAVIFLMYHRWGNTTEVATFGHSAFHWMTSLWRSARIYGGTSLSFGWFVPLLVLLLIWRDRAALRALVPRVSWLGLGVVLLALFLHWMGLRAQQTRLSLLALALLIWAIPYYLYGWPIARRLLYPCALLVFCVPLNFLDVFTFPLMRGAAALAGGLLSGLGLAVTRQGSLLQPQPMTPEEAPSLPFDGSDAAGGLGILLLLLLGTAIWCGWHRRSVLHRIALLAAVPVVHLVANALRLTTAGLLQAAAGDSVAQAFMQQGSRVTVFVIGALLVLLLDLGLRSWKKINLWHLLQPTPPSIG